MKSQISIADFKKIPTTKEVYAAIHASHPELVVFGSFSNSEGSPRFGGPEMWTSYGFKNQEYPIICAQTKWEKDADGGYKRINETHKYWLCVVIKPED